MTSLSMAFFVPLEVQEIDKKEGKKEMLLCCSLQVITAKNNHWPKDTH